MSKTIRIEIVFPVPVNFPDGFEQKLSEIVDTVCKKYESENPDRVMWPFGHGAKPIWDEPNEPEWNSSILQIEVAEREKY